MDYSLLFQAITAVATLAVPVVVAIMAHRFNDQLRRWEASQWRNQELIKARLEYYRELVPQLNDLMCYFTFVGGWKDLEPPAVQRIKRKLDRDFFCAVPLFDDDVRLAYNRFIANCFETFGGWGADARLKTGFGQRRKAAGQDWDSSWEALFTHHESHYIPPSELSEISGSYNALIAAFAGNIELSAPRDRYVNTDSTANAH